MSQELILRSHHQCADQGFLLGDLFGAPEEVTRFLEPDRHRGVRPQRVTSPERNQEILLVICPGVAGVGAALALSFAAHEDDLVAIAERVRAAGAGTVSGVAQPRKVDELICDESEGAPDRAGQGAREWAYSGVDAPDTGGHLADGSRGWQGTLIRDPRDVT
jgi:hypothetical protein